MLSLLHNLPWAWLFTAVVVGFIGHAIYAHDLWPISGDAALVVLAHTGWFGLFVAVALFAARRWPAWCDDVAQACPQLAMRTLLPGLSARAPTKRAPAPVTGSTHRLSEREWLNWCNNREDAPHLVATGATRHGKTTIILAAMGERAGQIVVCTPKPPSKDPWGGINAVRLGTAAGALYRPMSDAVRSVYAEMLARYAGDVTDAEWITLVIDEYGIVSSAEKEIRDMVLEMWGLSAAAKIRIVVLSTEANVKAWGLEGRGEARQNLVFLKAHIDQHGRRSATMARWGETPQPIDIRNVKRRADAVDLSARGWSPAPSSAGRQTQPLAPAAQPDPIKVAILRPFRAAGLKRDQVRASGITFSNEDWTAAA